MGFGESALRDAETLTLVGLLVVIRTATSYSFSVFSAGPTFGFVDTLLWDHFLALSSGGTDLSSISVEQGVRTSASNVH